MPLQAFLRSMAPPSCNEDGNMRKPNIDRRVQLLATFLGLYILTGILIAYMTNDRFVLLVVMSINMLMGMLLAYIAGRLAKVMPVIRALRNKEDGDVHDEPVPGSSQ